MRRTILKISCLTSEWHERIASCLTSRTSVLLAKHRLCANKVSLPRVPHYMDKWPQGAAGQRDSISWTAVYESPWQVPYGSLRNIPAPARRICSSTRDKDSIVHIECLHVLRADAHTDEVRAYPARKFRTFQEPDKPREPCWFRVQEATPGLFPDQLLHALREPGGKRAAALYLREIVGTDCAFAKGFCQEIGRRDGVLDGQIDPDTAHRRHGVGRIADAYQAGAIPPPQAIDLNGQ